LTYTIQIKLDNHSECHIHKFTFHQWISLQIVHSTNCPVLCDCELVCRRFAQ